MCNRENRQVIWCSYLEIGVLGFLSGLHFMIQAADNYSELVESEL